MGEPGGGVGWGWYYLKRKGIARLSPLKFPLNTTYVLSQWKTTLVSKNSNFA